MPHRNTIRRTLFTSDHDIFRESVRRFVELELVPNHAAWERGRHLRLVLEQLPAEQREIIELAYFGGLTHSELAEHLGLPLGTVKGRLRLGLEKLRVLWLDETGNKK